MRSASTKYWPLTVGTIALLVMVAIDAHFSRAVCRSPYAPYSQGVESLHSAETVMAILASGCLGIAIDRVARGKSKIAYVAFVVVAGLALLTSVNWIPIHQHYVSLCQ